MRKGKAATTKIQFGSCTEYEPTRTNMKRLVSKHTEEAAAGRDEKLETCLVMFGYPTIPPFLSLLRRSMLKENIRKLTENVKLKIAK